MKLVLVLATLGLVMAHTGNSMFATDSKHDRVCLCCNVIGELVTTPSACLDYGYFNSVDGQCPPLEKDTNECVVRCALLDFIRPGSFVDCARACLQ